MKNINSLQSGIVKQNDVNDPSVHTYRGKNQFPQSFQHPSTCSYGYVDPVAVAKCEVGDVFPYKFVTDLNTFTMKSPLKSEVKMYSAAFKVPLEAIYPRNYKILMSFAQKGDEVPQDTPTSSTSISHSARAIFPARQFIVDLLGFIQSLYEDLTSGASNDTFTYLCKAVFLLESVLSAGSIFSKMNIHLNGLKLSRYYPYSEAISFDKWFDVEFYPYFSKLVDGGTVVLTHSAGTTDEPGGYPSYVVTNNSFLFNLKASDDEGIASYYCSIDRAFELLRTGDYSISCEWSELQESLELLIPVFRFDLHGGNNLSFIPEFINIEPIIAYQLSCIQFFNNPKIDYIYNVDLWRDNLQAIVMETNVVNPSLQFTFPSFEYNGSRLLYDVVSYDVMSNVLLDYDSLPDRFFNYFFHLFAFHRSLRYGDYFVGSRPEPIGVGDINLEEDGSGDISSLEVARKLQLTRLLHKVAITGPEHSQQIKYIFGGSLPSVPSDVPIRLSLEEFDVSGFETNNTGAAQLSDENPNITTTNLRLNDSKFMFEVQINEPCWLVMVQYFEAHRIYSNTIDRMAFHYDLYDDFVPDMQYIGDQDVKQSELLGVYGNQFLPFAYHLRNMEYKQRVSYASGGFIEFLPSWAFITDNADGNPASGHISPEYIRSSPSEFDRFYKSLVGHSMASRFHFITMTTNVMAPYRQMVYAPEILA